MRHRDHHPFHRTLFRSLRGSSHTPRRRHDPITDPTRLNTILAAVAGGVLVILALILVAILGG